ncbi:MAG: tRNA (guanosine(37)-N1)-methyltransferase TrmD [Firmicutes bacterium]|nr:tRNA (guanosine(37)-N1)-methyltransferase TrmD [Bacillota bacterium]
MKINVLTTFPEMFVPVTEQSILGKAGEKGLIEVNLINIRDHTLDKHNATDDTPFGGGCGMVMTPQPIFDALRSLGEEVESHPMIYMSPRGKILDKELITELAAEEEFTILCGHYEGVDQRVLDRWKMKEVSIGDYILTGGELPAMVLIDCVSRFIPGVLGNEGSADDESIYSGLLEADQYTRPREYEGMEVPEILAGGNHHKISLWKLRESIRLTAETRPDLLKAWLESEPDLSAFTKAERKELKDLIERLK